MVLQKKWGKEIERVKCYSVDYFKDMGDKVTVFVSPENSEELEKELKKAMKKWKF